MKITSLQNKFVKHLDKLKQKKYRDENQEVLLEGEHLVEELKTTDFSYQTIGLDSNNDIQITKEIAHKISQTKSGSEHFALLKIPQFKLERASRVLLCDTVQDPGNLGTIIRTAYSFGIDAVIVSDDSADIWSGKTLRSSQGAALHLPTLRLPILQGIALCKSLGMQVYVADLDADAIGLQELQKNHVAVVLGSEGQGISKAAKEASDGSVMIEMTQFESLNVAVASALIAYHIKK
ncbi:MAG TPA: RNA methyltransferase [Erysipelothrix sp.]